MSSSRIRLAALAGLLLLLAVACGTDKIVTLTSGSARVRAEVARSGAELAKGLMGRGSLGRDDGMLFVFPEDRYMAFWMKDTLIPLSIAYLSSDGRVLEIHDMEPMDLRSVESSVKARYALEVNQGWFEANSVRVGDRFDVPDQLSSPNN